MWSVKTEGLQFPVWDAGPLIAPLHPDRSFRKYIGTVALTCTTTHPPPSRLTPLEEGWGTVWQGRYVFYHHINEGIV